MANIIYYDKTNVPSLDGTITWDQLLGYLKAGYDPRSCGTTEAAEDNINNGVVADALAVYESFPHFIWRLNNQKKITIQDPFKNAATEEKKIHSLSFANMGSYAKVIRQPDTGNAWKMVLMAFDLRFGFNDAVKKTICEAFYTALHNFVDQFMGNTGKAAFIVVGIAIDMRYYGEDEYGGFGKRGAGQKFVPGDFARRIWSGSWDPNNGNDRAQVVRDAVSGIVYMTTQAGLPTPP